MARSGTDTAVIMAAFNAEQTIAQAVGSIVNGTLPVDLYVVDDCSDSLMADHLAPFRDRIEVIRLDENAGPANARNVALKRVLQLGYTYVAIMDADDIAHPSRLDKQRAFMEAHPGIGVSGTAVREFDGDTNATLRIFKRPATPEGVRNAMYFNIGVAHPCAMFRCDVLREVGLYATAYPAAEDYELMRRILQRHEMANLDECLLDYRIWPGGASQRRRYRQLFDRLRIQIRYFEGSNWRAWAGIGKTLAAIVISDRILQPAKLAMSRLRDNRRRTASPPA